MCEHAMAVRKTHAVSLMLLQRCNVSGTVFQSLTQSSQPFVRLAGACIRPKHCWQSACRPWIAWHGPG